MKIAELLAGAPSVLTIDEDDDLAQAIQIMTWAKIHQLPVTREGRVVGVLSQSDVLRAQSGQGREAGGQQRVGAVMSARAEVISPDAEVAEASARMLDRRVGCLPVVDGERLVGIVTRSDVLATLAGSHRRRPGTGESITVAQVMTRAPQTARIEDNLLDAILLMAEAGVRHLPVVDGEYHVIGIVSDRDIRENVGDPAETYASISPAQAADPLLVGDVMTSPPLTVHQDEDLLTVTGDLVDQRVGAFAVIDEYDRLVGMLSYIDVLGALYRRSRAAE